MHTVYIGIGSNIGNREDNCERAINLLSARGQKVKKTSALIETEPWGEADQRAFINAAVCIETAQTPDRLLSALQEIETLMGRTRTLKWGPRIIDLDILFYDDLIQDTADLSIPHPYIQDRLFVLAPLAEIAPDLVHPVLLKSIQDLLAEYHSKKSS